MAKIVDTTGVVLYENYAKDFFDTLQEASDNGFVLSLVDLSDEAIHGISFTDVVLTGADMSRAGLSNACFWYADLSGANLWGADLSKADLKGAVLRGANLQGANLSGANLEGADLQGANLEGAELSGANFDGADLRLTRLYYHDRGILLEKRAKIHQMAAELWGPSGYRVKLIHDQLSWAGGQRWSDLLVAVKEEGRKGNDG
jgi:hypothetical protein|nr:MAG TPA: pentapeptide repeat protein [Caudoviricetes sp.]